MTRSSGYSILVEKMIEVILDKILQQTRNKNQAGVPFRSMKVYD